MTTTTTTTPTPIEPASTPARVAPAAPATHASIWTASRIIALIASVLEVLLIARFALKLFGANAEQALVSAIYGVTEPLVAPFRGIFAQPAGTPVVEIATLLSIVFLVLVAALAVAIVRAATGRRGEGNPAA